MKPERVDNELATVFTVHHVGTTNHCNKSRLQGTLFGKYVNKSKKKKVMITGNRNLLFGWFGGS